MEQVLKVIYNVLSATSSVTDLTTNLYPIIAPEQTDFPVIVYNIESVTPFDTKSGASTLDHMYVSIDSYAKDTTAASGYETVSTLSEAIRDTLDRLAPTTYATITVDGCQFINGETGYDGESDVFVSSMEFKFRVKR